jgi:hypothetical protein
MGRILAFYGFPSPCQVQISCQMDIMGFDFPQQPLVTEVRNVDCHDRLLPDCIVRRKASSCIVPKQGSNQTGRGTKRRTRLELATICLEGRCATIALPPQSLQKILQRNGGVKHIVVPGRGTVKMGREGFEPPKTIANRFTVCPLWPLGYLPNQRITLLARISPAHSSVSWRRDLNPRPADYKSAALPTELRQQAGES